MSSTPPVVRNPESSKLCAVKQIDQGGGALSEIQDTTIFFSLFQMFLQFSSPTLNNSASAAYVSALLVPKKTFFICTLCHRQREC